MSNKHEGCVGCGRKILPSVSNRCLYCGVDLPQEHHLSREEKTALVTEKFERFRQNAENADEIVSAMRRDFGIPEPRKSRKKRKQDNAAAAAAAIAGINTTGNGGNGGSGC